MESTTQNDANFTQPSHIRKGRILEYITVSWDILEALGAMTAASLSGSVALLSYGIDSIIEVSSGTILLWRLQDGEKGEARELVAARLVGISLIALAVYILYDAGSSLYLHQPPETSYLGIVIAAVSVILMPILARAKRKVAQDISSKAMHADSRQTDICAYLSAILLAGLGLNALFGWWWADPVAALIMIPIIIKEGWEALQGETCDNDCC
jgi:divalent metal cation (Fe/Co/Zn/Cd) transporter